MAAFSVEMKVPISQYSHGDFNSRIKIFYILAVIHKNFNCFTLVFLIFSHLNNLICFCVKVIFIKCESITWSKLASRMICISSVFLLTFPLIIYYIQYFDKFPISSPPLYCRIVLLLLFEPQMRSYSKF